MVIVVIVLLSLPPLLLLLSQLLLVVIAVIVVCLGNCNTGCGGISSSCCSAGLCTVAYLLRVLGMPICLAPVSCKVFHQGKHVSSTMHRAFITESECSFYSPGLHIPLSTSGNYSCWQKASRCNVGLISLAAPTRSELTLSLSPAGHVFRLSMENAAALLMLSNGPQSFMYIFCMGAPM